MDNCVALRATARNPRYHGGRPPLVKPFCLDPMLRWSLIGILMTIPALGVSGAVCAQDSPWNEVTIMPSDLTNPKAPRHEDFAVPTKFSGTPHEIDLTTHRQAKMWRTRLREGASAGANFADHYIIVTWGCGTDCSQLAIVDALNGAVYFPKALGAVAAVNVHDQVLKGGVLRFRRDSRLLIAIGMPNEDASQRGVSYYEWTGGDLKLVFRIKRKWYDRMGSNHPMQPTAGSGG